MSKPLFTLKVAMDDHRTSLHFETYEALLATMAAFVAAPIEGIEVEEDPATRLVFSTPAKALAHARLWAESFVGKAPAPESTSRPVAAIRRPVRGTRGDQIIRMLSRKGGASLTELVETFGIRKNSVRALISTETRRRDLRAVYKDGVYTVTPAAGGEGTSGAATESRQRPH